MRARKLIKGAAIFALLVGLAIQVRGAAHEHHHYKLIDLGTLDGPQSLGDAGHGAANITNGGVAAGVADTATPDQNCPNFSAGA